MNNNISGLPSVDVTTLTGSFIDYKPNWTVNLVARTSVITPVHTGIWMTRPKTSTWWSLTQKASVKALRVSVIKWHPKSTSRGQYNQRSENGIKG